MFGRKGRKVGRRSGRRVAGRCESWEQGIWALGCLRLPRLRALDLVVLGTGMGLAKSYHLAKLNPQTG